MPLRLRHCSPARIGNSPPDNPRDALRRIPVSAFAAPSAAASPLPSCRSLLPRGLSAAPTVRCLDSLAPDDSILSMSAPSALSPRAFSRPSPQLPSDLLFASDRRREPRVAALLLAYYERSLLLLRLLCSTFSSRASELLLILGRDSPSSPRLLPRLACAALCLLPVLFGAVSCLSALFFCLSSLDLSLFSIGSCPYRPLSGLTHRSLSYFSPLFPHPLSSLISASFPPPLLLERRRSLPENPPPPSRVRLRRSES
ncbi:hypothetical protein WJX73_005214 [Symbiochloris irregularis]|uniref:Transmembrane protein n=1 Tax=Symbiochloris irregularis TaxID=706552 RepID=A0AAW1PYL4_9CHLO